MSDRSPYARELAAVRHPIRPRPSRLRGRGVSHAAVRRLAVSARSCQPGAARLHWRARADVADRICRPDFARHRRPAGRRRLRRRRSGPRNRSAILADVAGGGRARRMPRIDLRPAFAAAARTLPRHQHARTAFRGYLSRRRIRGALDAFDRDHDRFAFDRRMDIEQRAGVVFRAAGVCGVRAPDQRQPATHADRPGVAGATRARRRRRAHSVSTCRASSSWRSWSARP